MRPKPRDKIYQEVVRLIEDTDMPVGALTKDKWEAVVNKIGEDLGLNSDVVKYWRGTLGKTASFIAVYETEYDTYAVEVRSSRIESAGWFFRKVLLETLRPQEVVVLTKYLDFAEERIGMLNWASEVFKEAAEAVGYDVQTVDHTLAGVYVYFKGTGAIHIPNTYTLGKGLLYFWRRL